MSTQSRPEFRVPPMSVVTIGIDLYANPQYNTLKGCVADADAMELYLLATFDIPGNRIKSLRNAEATRSAIIKVLVDLKEDDEIDYDDAIVIFYAGHGGEAPTPKSWTGEESMTQMIIPHDCEQEVDREITHGIPDRTIGWLLKEIADAKGNNITVILDSCFSGSGTRSLIASDYGTPRAIEYQSQLPDDLDRRIWEKRLCVRALSIAPGFFYGGLRSHVLISACGSGERALERGAQGVFTAAFLNITQQVVVENRSYHEFLSLVGVLSSQNPQCEGYFANRLMFTQKMRQQNWELGCYDATLGHDTHEMRFHAGIAHGITKGSKFHLWRDTGSCDGLALAEATVSAVNTFTSTAQWTVEFATLNGTSFVGKVKEWGDRPDFHLHVPNDRVLETALQVIQDEIKTPHYSSRMTIKLSLPHEAWFSIVPVNDGLAIDVHKEELTRLGLKRLPHTIKFGPNQGLALRRVLRGLSHYEYHLRRRNIEAIRFGGTPFRDLIEVEFLKLESNTGAEQETLVGDIQNVKGKVIDFVEDGCWHAIKIRNNSPLELYPLLYYFDNCDLSINLLYKPPSAGKNKVDPPLKAHQTLTLGYGGGGTPPYVCDVRGAQPLELGFLKLFLSTEYVTLPNMQQESPFSVNVKASRPAKEDPVHVWDAINIPFLLRRNPALHVSGPVCPEAPLVFTMEGTWKSTFIASPTMDAVSELVVVTAQPQGSTRPNVHNHVLSLNERMPRPVRVVRKTQLIKGVEQTQNPTRLVHLQLPLEGLHAFFNHSPRARLDPIQEAVDRAWMEGGLSTSPQLSLSQDLRFMESARRRIKVHTKDLYDADQRVEYLELVAAQRVQEVQKMERRMLQLRSRLK